MSIASQITRLQTLKTNIRSALVYKGIEAASAHDMEDFEEDIRSIQTDVPDLNGATLSITSDIGATIVAQKGGKKYTSTISTELPSTYQKVEYIESHGTEHIDIEYIPNGNTRWVLDLQLSSVPTGGGVAFRNGRYGEGQRFAITAVNGGWEFASGSYVNYGTADTQRHILELDNARLKAVIDGVDVVDLTSSTWTNTDSIYLFRRNYFTTDGSVGAKIYSSQIYENNIIVRNYVPCYRKSDNVVGVYDTINEQFYTNGGTGTFGKGAEIGSVTFTVRNSGIWTVTASKDGEETISQTVNVVEDGATYEVSMFWKTVLYTVGDKPSNIGYYEYKSAGTTIPLAENQWLSDGAILQCGTTNDNRRALNYLRNVSPIVLGNSVSINIVGGSKYDASDSYWLVASTEPPSLLNSLSSFPYFSLSNTTKAVLYKSFSNLTYGVLTLDTSALKGMTGYVAVMVGSYNRTEAIKFKDWIVE